MNLDMDNAKAKRFDVLEDKSIEIIQQGLDGNNIDDTVKAAIKILGVVAKNRQTLTARQAINYNMARDLEDKDKLRKYIEATNPEIKRLTAK